MALSALRADDLGPFRVDEIIECFDIGDTGHVLLDAHAVDRIKAMSPSRRPIAIGFIPFSRANMPDAQDSRL